MNEEERFQTNSSVRSVSMSNKNYLLGPVANLTCFQKIIFYAGIKIFNNLSCSIIIVLNEKAEFEVALKRLLKDTFPLSY
jgi:hypothetical protein